MALFWRIPCHFCGKRSPLPKWSSATEYQCSGCEAWNFLDGKGNIVDTPITITASASPEEMERTRNVWEMRTRSAAQVPGQQQQQEEPVFCNTCLQNQQIATEMLGNYLPDDEDPRYAQFEASLPQYKRDLEQRYPAICKACAPKAQRKINRADYYSGTSNIALSMKRNKGGVIERPSRDDRFKWAMRVFLGLTGLAIWTAFYLQVAWHIYAIHTTILGSAQSAGDDSVFAPEPTMRSCIQAASHLQTDPACFKLFAGYIPRALLTTLLTVWYNRDLSAYYDPFIRYDHITGQKQHFIVQAVTLLVRGYSYFYLSNPTLTSEMKWSEVVAAHTLSIAFMLPARLISSRITEAHKWRLGNRRMMPKPEDEDVLGKVAGPARESYTPQASTKPPFDIFAKKPDLPFPIDALAPKSNNASQRSAYGSLLWNRMSGGPPPSPQDSDSGDAMDVDIEPVVADSFAGMPGRPTSRKYDPHAATSGMQLRSSTNAASNRFGNQPNGWGSMRDEIFGMDDSMRAEQERKRQEEEQKLSYNPQPRTTPFYGRLPQAPMSMERRLRNPVKTLPEFKAPPVTQQQNFFEQMRPGLQSDARTQGVASSKKAIPKSTPLNNSRYAGLARPSVEEDDEDSDFSPARDRTRGSLNLRASNWHLPSDTARQATGLEDLFGGKTFRISESPQLPPDTTVQAKGMSTGAMLCTALAVAVFGVVTALTTVFSFRRWVCLKLVEVIEWFGL